LTATNFFFKHCDGKLSDEDLNAKVYTLMTLSISSILTRVIWVKSKFQMRLKEKSTERKSRLLETTSLMTLLNKTPSDTTNIVAEILRGLLTAMLPPPTKIAIPNMIKQFRKKPSNFGNGIFIQMTFIFEPILTRTSSERKSAIDRVSMITIEEISDMPEVHFDIAETTNGNCESPRPINQAHDAQKINFATFFVKSRSSDLSTIENSLAKIAANIFEKK